MVTGIKDLTKNSSFLPTKFKRYGVADSKIIVGSEEERQKHGGKPADEAEEVYSTEIKPEVITRS